MQLSSPLRYAAAVFVAASLGSLVIVVVLYHRRVLGGDSHHLAQLWWVSQPLFVVVAAVSMLVYRWFSKRRSTLSLFTFFVNVATCILLVALVVTVLSLA